MAGAQKNETSLVEPLSLSALKELETTEAPSNADEAKALETKMGFGYRSVIGELTYAYVTCRLDIGYAVAELS